MVMSFFLNQGARMARLGVAPVSMRLLLSKD